MQRTEMVFQHGSILRKEMLEDIYQYPRAAVESYYSAYSDGILYGLEWKDSKEHPGHHIIMPGALKFHGKIYYLCQVVDVEGIFPEVQIDAKYRIFFRKTEVVEEASRKIYEMKLSLVQSSGMEEAWENGFYYSYIEVDHNKSFVQIKGSEELYALYAARNGFAFSAQLLREDVLQKLESKQKKHPLDFEILRFIYSGEAIPAELILLYVREADFPGRGGGRQRQEALWEQSSGWQEILLGQDGEQREVSRIAKKLYDEFLEVIEGLEYAAVIREKGSGNHQETCVQETVIRPQGSL